MPILPTQQRNGPKLVSDKTNENTKTNENPFLRILYMSQSDYIQYKKNTVQLKRLATTTNKYPEYPSVLESKDYTEFSMYSIENQGTNTKSAFSRLIPVGKQDVFGMEKKINESNQATTCPIPFLLCKRTDQRPNRILNTVSIPATTYRLKKHPVVPKCTFTSKNGFLSRTVPCTKKECKCRTTIYKQGFTNVIEKNT